MSPSRQPIDVVLQWGIGNRVNGLINGLILSRFQQRPVRYAWMTGKHCQAQFCDLFLDADLWLESLGTPSAHLGNATGGKAYCLPHTLFCAPLDEYSIVLRKELHGMRFEQYAQLYQQFWSQLRWSREVTGRVDPSFNGPAFHARTHRKSGSYAPPLDQELVLISEGAFVACDSEAWKAHYLRVLPKSFCLPTNNGDSDFSGRDRVGMIAAASDLLMLSQASQLFVHSPVESTYFLPATYGALVPTALFAWRNRPPDTQLEPVEATK